MRAVEYVRGIPVVKTFQQSVFFLQELSWLYPALQRLGHEATQAP